MGKSTISMAILSSYVKLPEGNTMVFPCFLILSVLSLPGRDPHENVLALDHIPAEIWWKAMDFETRFHFFTVSTVRIFEDMAHI